MRSIVDVNVLLPLVIRAHPAHSAAIEWFDTQREAGVGWSLPVQLEFLRLLCDSKVMGQDTLLPTRALDVWVALAANPRMTEIRRIPVEHEAHLRRLIADRGPSPNVWTDAWLAALAICLSCEMVTFDRGFRSFDGVDLRLLLAGS